MEDVEEVRQHEIVVIDLPGQHILTERQGHRPVNPGQAKERHGQPRRLAFAQLQVAQHPRLEAQRYRLPQTQRVLMQVIAGTQAWRPGVKRIDAAQGTEKIKAPGPGLQLAPEI